MKDTDRLDAVIIGGDVPDEYLGKTAREEARLTVDGHPASLRFLSHYFSNGRNPDAAHKSLQGEGLPFVSLNGPWLQAQLSTVGLKIGLVPLLSPCAPDMVKALARRPRAVLISTTFLPFAKHIDQIAAAIRKQAPDAVIIAGGVQVWKSYRHYQLLAEGECEEDLRDAVSEHSYFTDRTRPSPVDVFVVSPRGEATLADLLVCIRDGKSYADLPNLALYEDGEWRFSAQVAEAYREVKIDWSTLDLNTRQAYLPVQAGEGCGFDCGFCDFRGLRPVHRRSTASIIDEIRTVPEHDGLRRVYFTDDNLFSSPTRAREICQALISSGLRVRWRGMVRVDIVNSEIAELMAESGCIEVLLGIESGDPDILRRMGKRSSPDQILNAVRDLARAGINTKSTFIVGYPGETEETLERTVALLNAYPTDEPAVHRYLFFQFGVLPLSSIASPASRERYGLSGYGYEWQHSTMCADEARAHLRSLPDRIKEELAPSYVLEVPELSGMTVARMKDAFILRNRLARAQRSTDGAPCETLWDQLEQCFCGPCAQL